MKSDEKHMKTGVSSQAARTPALSGESKPGGDGWDDFEVEAVEAPQGELKARSESKVMGLA